MPSAQSQQSGGSGTQAAKTIIAVILVVGGLGFLYAQYQKVQPPERAERPRTIVATTGPNAGQEVPNPNANMRPSREERAAMRDQLLASLNLSPEQQEQMDALQKKYEGVEGRDRRGMFREAREILTPEQQEQARAQMMGMFRARMEQRMAVLPEGEKEKFREKLEERMAEGRGPFGRGGRGGGQGRGGNGGGPQGGGGRN
jgi:hypothetical protein